MRSLAFLMPKRHLLGMAEQQRYGIFAPRYKNLRGFLFVRQARSFHQYYVDQKEEKGTMRILLW